MKTISSIVVFSVLIFCPNLISSQNDPYKTVVTYLGTDFIMPDGCPPPKCDPELRECRKEMIDLEKEYNDCLAGEDGEFLGCVTDTLPNRNQITVPMYAKLCSAICYIREEDKRKQVHRCPHDGRKHEDVDPNLERLF